MKMRRAKPSANKSVKSLVKLAWDVDALREAVIDNCLAQECSVDSAIWAILQKELNAAAESITKKRKRNP